MSKICLRMDYERITNSDKISDWKDGKFVFIPDPHNRWKLNKDYVGILRGTYITDKNSPVFEVVLLNGDLYNTDKVRKAKEVDLDEYSGRTDIIINIDKDTLIKMYS